MRFGRKSSAFGAAVMLAVLSFGQAAKADLKEISIALTSTSFPLAGVRAADKLGLFQKNGIRPKFTVADNSTIAMAALVAGSVDFATVGMDSLVALHARGNTNVVAIAANYRGQAGVVVVGNGVAKNVSSAASTAERLKALEGIKVATPSAASNLTTALRIWGEREGVKIEFVYMAQNAMAAALETGAIQAYTASSPFWEPAVTKGTARRWLSGPQGEFPEDLAPVSAMETSRTYAQKNPDIIRGVRATLRDLVTVIRERPDDVLRALKEVYPELSEQVIKSAFEANSPNWQRPELSEHDLDREVTGAKRSALQNAENVDAKLLGLTN